MKKFEKIYFDIERQIHQQILPTNAFLPSEHQLSETYGVSRETIRKVLKLLEDNGYIQKKQGLGSIVLDFRRFSLPISGLTSYKELQEQQQIKAVTKVIQNQRIPVPGFLRGTEDIEDDENFIHLVRTRSVNGEVLIVDEDFLRCKLIPKVNDTQAENSIYEYFEKDLGLAISYATKEIRADRANLKVSQLLEIGENDYIINVRSHVYLEDTTFFQYTLSHHKLDKFRFFDFARRKPIFSVRE